MRDGKSPGIPRFVGSSSGIHFVRTVYDILARTSGQPPRAQSELVPGEDDQLDGTRGLDSGPGSLHAPGTGARVIFWRDEEILSSEESITYKPTFAELARWCRQYFEVWHRAYPFLDGCQVLEILEQLSETGIESLSAADTAIVRSILSIVVADARQLPNNKLPAIPLSHLFLSLEHVTSSISFILGSPATLGNMQAALAVELFLVSILKFNMASRIGGVIVRMAYHLVGQPSRE